MHLHSNIQFEDNDGSEQYYRKNQTPPPLPLKATVSSHASHVSSVAGMPTPHDPQTAGPSINQPQNLSSIQMPQTQLISQFSQGSQNSQIPYLNNPSSSRI